MDPKFIVCEDNPDVMEFYKSFFKTKKINPNQIAFFEDGRGAVDLIQKLTNSNIFLLTDFNMPFVNGALVLKSAIQKEVPFKILRTSMDIQKVRDILDTKYGIKNDVVIISKAESIKRLKEELISFQENYM